MAWWRYESPIPWPGLSRSRSALWTADLLGADEKRELEAAWCEQFNRSLAPGFSFYDGPRGILTGWDAHIAHLVFHDVPSDLAEQWAAARVAPPGAA
jgi:hypothetical protein